MATLLFTVSHIYADKFTVNEFVINAGETKTISINLTNNKTIFGFQFSIYFPDEVTITARNSGALKISANQDRLYNWSTILSIEITASDMIDTRNKFVYIKKQKLTINNANGDPVTIDADETTTESPCTLQIPVKIGSSG